MTYRSLALIGCTGCTVNRADRKPKTLLAVGAHAVFTRNGDGGRGRTSVEANPEASSRSGLNTLGHKVGTVCVVGVVGK